MVVLNGITVVNLPTPVKFDNAVLFVSATDPTPAQPRGAIMAYPREGGMGPSTVLVEKRPRTRIRERLPVVITYVEAQAKLHCLCVGDIVTVNFVRYVIRVVDVTSPNAKRLRVQEQTGADTGFEATGKEKLYDARVEWGFNGPDMLLYDVK